MNIRIAYPSNKKRGATFIVWIIVLSTISLMLLGSIMTGSSDAYRRGVDFHRRTQAMYLAEAGISKFIAEARAGSIGNKKQIKSSFEEGEFEVSINERDGNYALKSKGTVKNGKASWNETIVVEIDGSKYKVLNYYWTGRNETK